MIPQEFLASDASAILGSFANELASMSFVDAFKKTTDSLHDGFQANFTNTRAPYGTWPPHAPYTIQKYGPHPLLILTGAMLASVTQSGSDGRIEQISSNEMVIGTSLFYAGFQQYGTLKIPPRPFLWLDGDHLEKVTEAFVSAISSILT
jgi:phage gpG-like protein